MSGRGLKCLKLNRREHRLRGCARSDERARIEISVLSLACGAAAGCARSDERARIEIRQPHDFYTGTVVAPAQMSGRGLKSLDCASVPIKDPGCARSSERARIEINVLDLINQRGDRVAPAQMSGRGLK